MTLPLAARRRRRVPLRLHPDSWQFVTPSLVGGANGYMYGNQIVDLFETGFPDWETGSVLAIFLLGVVVVLMIAFSRFLQPKQVSSG